MKQNEALSEAPLRLLLSPKHQERVSQHQTGTNKTRIFDASEGKRSKEQHKATKQKQLTAKHQATNKHKANTDDLASLKPPTNEDIPTAQTPSSPARISPFETARSGINLQATIPTKQKEPASSVRQPTHCSLPPFLHLPPHPPQPRRPLLPSLSHRHTSLPPLCATPTIFPTNPPPHNPTSPPLPPLPSPTPLLPLRCFPSRPPHTPTSPPLPPLPSPTRPYLSSSPNHPSPRHLQRVDVEWRTLAGNLSGPARTLYITRSYDGWIFS